MLRRTLVVCAALLFVQPMIAIGAVQHHAIGLVPSRLYDVWSDGQMIAEGIPSSPAGTMDFVAEVTAPLRITLSGVVGDFIPPGPVSTLSVTSTTGSSVTMRWTAVGDDGNIGQATRYDLRYSTAPIDVSNWTGASQATGEPTPGPAGQIETFTLEGLETGTTYYLALKVGDEVPNWSALSNVAEGATREALDGEPPDPISDLAGYPLSHTMVLLLWTAVGDDGRVGNAAAYELRTSLAPIDSSSWERATPIPINLAPGDPGHRESFPVGGLMQETDYHFVLRARDEAGNLGRLSPDVVVRTPQVPDASAPVIPETIDTQSQGDRVHVTWSPSASLDVVDYTLYRRRVTLSDVQERLEFSGVHGVSFADSSVLPNARYAYAIAARDGAGNLSPRSEEVFVDTRLDDFVPEVTDFLADGSVDLTGPEAAPLVHLSWTARTGRRFAGFIVERSQDDGRTWVTRSPNLLPKAETYEFAEEIEPGAYLYRVAALSNRGFARRFDPIPLRWEPGIAEAEIVGPFPNPSPGPMGLRFTLVERSRVRVMLYDLTGRRLGVLHDQVEEAGVRSWMEASAEASGLAIASGVYFLRIEVGEKATVRKLIVRR